MKQPISVGDLVAKLQKLDPSEPVICYFRVAGDVDWDREWFGKIAKYLAENEQFRIDCAEVFYAWFTEADDVIWQSEGSI
jgi:hypothetical protein